MHYACIHVTLNLLFTNLSIFSWEKYSCSSPPLDGWCWVICCFFANILSGKKLAGDGALQFDTKLNELGAIRIRYLRLLCLYLDCGCLGVWSYCRCLGVWLRWEANLNSDHGFMVLWWISARQYPLGLYSCIYMCTKGRSYQSHTMARNL